VYRKVALRMDFCLQHCNNDIACDLDFWSFAKWENRLCLSSCGSWLAWFNLR